MMTQIIKSVTRVVLVNPHTLAQSNKEETKAPFMIHRMSLVFKSMTIVFTVIFVEITRVNLLSGQSLK